ncbi:PqiC family protein [Acetobacter sp.]|jgi:uncharacterized lipoprotein YmbA|uniref:PqiC family protein n=1 Tax=Acetobacter sp. TaxID=440 RepID=UPI0025BCAB32|nr:PqiC family protein [Acetobacter sp.]MCH4090418.1 PqiC family protein [Acetobacter sp.]MCI1299112.1 PqiC family protein [Acetobacter sp.]MCI1315659.1 PqiC family protein [Acetobacter sp.]
MSGIRKKLPLTAGLVFAVSLTGCSSPPLRLYTLAGPATTVPLSSGPLAPTAPTLEISRVSLPDYLDSQDILTRNGQAIERSPNGRWAERLSNGITDLITARLSAARPDMFVTEQAPPGSASVSRIRTAVTRLDIPASGRAFLDANWTYIAGDDHISTRTDRVQLTSSVTDNGTDAKIVETTNDLVSQLSKAIASSLPQ